MSHDQPERCHKEKAKDAPPLFQNGNVNFQVYHIGWIISGAFALVAVVASFWLIDKHLQWYTNKREQRYIVRLLFLVPIYAIISFASFIFWNHATPLILVRDAYEAIVLTAFFYLLLMYISHDPEEQRKVFLKKGLSREADIAAKRKGLKVQKWMWPLGFVKWKPKDGLYFLQLMKWGVLQYCVIRPTTTLAAVILEYMGLYCETSWGLGWGHIWIMLIISISVSIAMYCLIQLYMPVSEDLARHKPLLKLFAIKAVVFLTFWQATFLSILSMAGLIKDTQFMTAEDINIGIGALLEDFEMMLFAFLHIRAFTYKVYRPEDDDNGLPPEKTPRWRSLGHAMDFRETFREIWVGCVYMFDKMRGKEPQQDHSVRRAAHYERAFGRERVLPGKPAGPSTTAGHSNPEKNPDRDPALKVAVHRELDIEGERQWLGVGKYGYLNPRRERSEGLQNQIDHELEKLGHPTTKERPRHATRQHERVSTNTVPWWRSLYSRISQHGQDPEPDDPNSVDQPYTGLLPRQDQRRRRSQSSGLVPKASRTPSGSRQQQQQQRRNRHQGNNTSPVPGPSRTPNQRDHDFPKDNSSYSLLQMNDRLPSPRRNHFDDDTSRYPAFGIASDQPNPAPLAHGLGVPPSSYHKVQEWRHYQHHPQPRPLSNSSQWAVPPRLAGTPQAQQLRDARISPPPSVPSQPLSPSSSAKALPSLPPTRPHPRSPGPPYAPQAPRNGNDDPHIGSSSSMAMTMPIPQLFASPIPQRLNSPVSSSSSTPPLSPPLPPPSPFEPRLNTSYVPGPTYVPVPSVLGGGHSNEAVILAATTSSPSLLSPGVVESPTRQRSSRALVEMPDAMVDPGGGGGGGNFDTRSSSHRREPAAAITTVFPRQRTDRR